ncbi:GTP cyclohydrolase FolE2 [Marinobacter sp. JSM 1782161]|uniref:GTP cyclohydrolase FolE2 n=1 Tax=Marinobacter sp. JSM 1782161 TaxID=2685906 RepID=UPI001403FFB7|nr:GTP cyclohydrolase FolE2 [Marinobacter sp. JSM 1782161]
MPADRNLVDVATESIANAGRLEWVGMEKIDLPARLAGRPVDVKVDAGVSLDDPTAKGIHMSRLYLALEALAEAELDGSAIESVLRAFLESQVGLSSSAFLSFSGELLLRRPALLSPLSGWKGYPFKVSASLRDARLDLRLDLSIGYSSTCPCSAALARQAIQGQFERDFPDDASPGRQAVLEWLGSTQGIRATPHSQRSLAEMSLHLANDPGTLPVQEIVDAVEEELGTPLQTAVKRIDEQAFAIANGQNLMFCEDAARRIDARLRRIPVVQGFRQRVTHLESLHAHDAVARSEWNWRP